jgi:hypothetical protein
MLTKVNPREERNLYQTTLIKYEDRVSPPMPAAFSVTMLTSSAAGDAYTLSELTAMYKEAAFGDVTAHPIPASPHTVVIGLG